MNSPRVALGSDGITASIEPFKGFYFLLFHFIVFHWWHNLDLFFPNTLFLVTCNFFFPQELLTEYIVADYRRYGGKIKIAVFSLCSWQFNSVLKQSLISLLLAVGYNSTTDVETFCKFVFHDTWHRFFGVLFIYFCFV